MTVEVSVETVESTPTAVVAAAVTWAEFPAMWKPMLDQVWSFLRGSAPDGLYRQGHNVMLYRDDVPNVEVGVQVVGSFDSVGRVTSSSLPGGLVATATHIGPVSALGSTHQAVRAWSEANGYQPAGPRWEIYGDPDPSTGDFRVEVFWLLAALHPAEVNQAPYLERTVAASIRLGASTGWIVTVRGSRTPRPAVGQGLARRRIAPSTRSRCSGSQARRSP